MGGKEHTTTLNLVISELNGEENSYYDESSYSLFNVLNMLMYPLCLIKCRKYNFKNMSIMVNTRLLFSK